MTQYNNTQRTTLSNIIECVLSFDKLESLTLVDTGLYALQTSNSDIKQVIQRFSDSMFWINLKDFKFVGLQFDADYLRLHIDIFLLNHIMRWYIMHVHLNILLSFVVVLVK